MGCSACAQVCQQKAIHMERAEDGFLYPQIEFKKCVQCSKCVSVCPLNSEKPEATGRTAFYGWHKDDTVRYNSSSGGAFSALADYVLQRDGVIYGAAFDGEKFYCTDTDHVSIDVLRKSKYTEINPCDSFSSVKANLEQGRMVLFCSTPCRVAGLVSFLCKKYEKLILVDFLCGGVASPKFLEENIAYLEKKYNTRIINIDFRHKKYGWGGQHCIKFDFVNGKSKAVLAKENAYFNGFLLKKINRTSCYRCEFISTRYADFTLADFWEYKKIPLLENNGQGISLLVTHTERAKALVGQLDTAVFNEMDYALVAGNFVPMGVNETKLPERNAFVNKACKIGFMAASKDFMKTLEILKYKMRNLIKVAFKIK